MIQVIETALRDGCGITLDAAIRSERYQQLLSLEQAYASRYSAKSNHGIAYRVGHLQMGRLFNIFGERRAIAEAKKLTVSAPHTEIRALLWYLGEQLVEAAKECLPIEAREMAQDWRRGNVQQQIEIAKQLYYLLRGEDLDTVGKEEYTWEKFEQHIVHRSKERLKHDAVRVLPKLYGRWGEGGDPNCQGKAQMFAAFAKLAGTRSYAVEPLLDGRMVKERWRQQVFHMIEQDLAQRNITYVDKTFRESLSVARLMQEFDREDYSFHVCITIRLQDGRWVMVDPHALSWGVMSSRYGMDRIDRMLTKYREVLPGLSLIACDNLTHVSIFKEQLEVAHTWLAKSRAMHQVVMQKEKDTSAITEALADSGDAVAIAQAFGMRSDTIEAFRLMGKDGARYLATMMFWNVDDPLEVMSQLGQVLTDPGYLDKRIDSLLTVYHCIVANMFRDQVSHEGLLVHPACEFRNTEFDLALAVVNSLRPARMSTEDSRFFLDHQFAQIALSNALHELGIFDRFGVNRNQPRDHQLGVAAAQALRALPVRHPICDRKLLQVSSFLKE